MQDACYIIHNNGEKLEAAEASISRETVKYTPYIVINLTNCFDKNERVLQQWFSSRGDFAPRGPLAMWKHFWLSHLGGRGYHWHLVGGGQGSCSSSYSAQDTPPQRRIRPQMLVVPTKGENCWTRGVIGGDIWAELSACHPKWCSQAWEEDTVMLTC